jgi:hypothetical protein
MQFSHKKILYIYVGYSVKGRHYMAGLATIGFVGTNYNNVCNKGDWTRIPVLTGQCFNAVDEGLKLAKKEESVMHKVDTIAKTNKAFNYSTKVINFVRKNINPLIVVSSGIKVAMAKKEDREKTFLTEGGCVAGMFIGEGWMKKNLSKYLEKLPVEKKWLPIIEGVVFVCGSLTSSTIGQNIGKKLAQYWNVPLGRIEKEANTQQTNQVYTKMDVKA